MSKKDKLIERLLSFPKDFTYDEARTLLSGLGYFEDTKGKSSGSRVAFVNLVSKNIITLHKPHPGNVLPAYAVKNIIEFLKRNGEIQ